jgi:hypothetical protein
MNTALFLTRVALIAVAIALAFTGAPMLSISLTTSVLVGTLIA